MSSGYKRDLLNFDKSIVDLSGKDMVEKLPTTEKYEKIFKIVDGELVYIGEKEEEKKWSKDLEIKIKGVDAQAVSKAPNNYYGKYVLNYTTGNNLIDQSVEWRIFYADEKNIYLITSDYVECKYLPKARKENADGTVTEYALNINGDYKADLRKVIQAYNGAQDITDSRLKALNSSYFEVLSDQTDTSNHMKAISYLMDTRKEVWGTFAGDKADFAIGGPTIEMLMKSYSQTNNVDYRAIAENFKGYRISIDGGVTWELNIKDVFDVNNDLYVLSEEEGMKPNMQWLASPSAFDFDCLMYSGTNGGVHYCYYLSYIGFRPIVCLKSGVELKAVGDKFELVL